MDGIGCQNISRGNRKRQKPLEEAIYKARNTFEDKWKIEVTSNISIFAQTPSDEPCLQIVDYINWSVFRAYNTREMRYFNVIRAKVSLLVDLYDTAKPKWQNFYNRKNEFEIKKNKPFVARDVKSARHEADFRIQRT